MEKKEAKGSNCREHATETRTSTVINFENGADQMLLMWLGLGCYLDKKKKKNMNMNKNKNKKYHDDM